MSYRANCRILSKLRHTMTWLGLMAVGLVGSIEGQDSPGEHVYTLQNGMKVILKENHSSPMISSMIFVESGSKYESAYENGITHFLEHLLFDGTVTKSRSEIDESIRNLGGYINAFTREDLTAYLVLVPSQYIEYAMTVQADMLFNSVFPEDELAKERKVVIEEINAAADRPDAAVEAFFIEKAYGNTDYSRPVLGYQPFIENIPRQAIIDYWRRYYTPEKMTTLVIGDFDSDNMKAAIERVFGSFENHDRGDEHPVRPLTERRRVLEDRKKNGAIDGPARFDTVANVSQTHLRFSIEGPGVDADDFLAFDILAQYLGMDEVSPLEKALVAGETPLATEITVSVNAREEFTRLEIGMLTDDPQLADTIVSVTISTLSSLPNHRPIRSPIEGLKTSIRCQAIYNAEKLHYYGFMIAPLLMSAGWEFIQQYPDRVADVTWDDCTQAAKVWLSDPDFILTVVRPADSTDIPFVPDTPTSEDIVSYFDTTEFPTYDLVSDRTIEYPSVDSTPLTISDESIYHREVFENGLTVIVKSNDESQVFAINIIGKNRTASEPEGLAGVTDFVNRCLEKGTATRDAARLAQDLAAIGANVTLYDNPWIPYDDRYTQRSFSFIKFETIDEFAVDGMALLADMVLHPRFDSTAVEQVRQEMLGAIRRDAASPSKVARDLFYSTYFAGTPYARGIMGDEQSISSIDIDALRSHHGAFYAPNNLVISVVTSRDTSEVLSWIRATFGDLPASIALAATPVSPEMFVTTRREHADLPSQQVAIYAGGRLPGAQSDEATDLSVATSILSSRLFSNLREREGLAYSTGASDFYERDFGWYYLSISTATDNLQQALDGLNLQAEKLAFDGPTIEEVSVARNQIWGRLMSAKLSRINQAYYLGLDEFLGRECPFDPVFLEEMRVVSGYSVRAVSSKYIRPGTWVVCSAGAY